MTSAAARFLRDKKTSRAELFAQYEFPPEGRRKIAWSEQDDQGGEKTAVIEVEVK